MAKAMELALKPTFFCPLTKSIELQENSFKTKNMVSVSKRSSSKKKCGHSWRHWRLGRNKYKDDTTECINKLINKSSCSGCTNVLK
jgi:hypothetical protein